MSVMHQRWPQKVAFLHFLQILEMLLLVIILDQENDFSCLL